MQSLNRFALVLLCSLLSLPIAAQQIDTNRWGKNTAGVEITTHEDPRQHTAAGTTLMYNIVGKGFPAGSYDLWGWVIGKQPQKLTSGASFDKRGVLVCSGKPGFCPGKTPDDPINIKTTAFLGEPKRFGVVSKDGRIAAFTEAVPFPMEATDKKCKLSIVQQEPQSEVIAVRASGFVPYELLTVSLHVGGKDSTHSPTATSDGAWQAIIGLKTAKETAGTASIKVSGQGCSVALNVPWGEGSARQQ